MSNNNEPIIDFESMFEDKQIENTEEKPLKISKGRSISIIAIYFSVFILLATIIQVVMITTGNGIDIYNSQESMLIQVNRTKYGLGYLSQSDYQQYHSEYENISVLLDDGTFVFFANKNNNLLNDIYAIEDILMLYETDNPVWKDGLIEQPVKRYIFSLNDAFESNYQTVIIKDDHIVTVSGFYVLNQSASTLLNFSLYVVLILSLIPISYGMFKHEFQLYDFKSNMVYTLLKGYGLMFLFSLVALSITSIIGTVFDYTPQESINQEGVYQALTSNIGFLMIFVTVIFAPIVEELVFRKAIFSLFKNASIALVSSSLLFGLIHVVSEPDILGFIVNLITYSASGFALGYIYIKNNHNIYSSILIHAFYNAIAVLLMFLL